MFPSMTKLPFVKNTITSRKKHKTKKKKKKKIPKVGKLKILKQNKSVV
jgi:hypothetical protein